EHLVAAAGLVPGPADLAGVVRGHEGSDHLVAHRDLAYRRAHLLHHAEVLVTHRGGLGLRVQAAVAPQVRTTHARAGDADDRVGVFLQHRVRAFFDPDVSGSVQHYASHAHSSSRWFRFYGPASMGPLISQNITPAASSAGRVVVRAKGPGAGDALAARFAVRARGRHAARCGHGALGFAAR